MALGDFFKSEHEHSDWRKRIQAITKMSDQTLLETIARTDHDHRVQLAAMKKLSNQQSIVEILLNGQDNLQAGFEAITSTSQLTDLFLKLEQLESKAIKKDIKVAIGNIEDQSKLAILVNATLEMNSKSACLAALAGIQDQTILEQLILTQKDNRHSILSKLIDKINDPSLLKKIILNQNQLEVSRLAAINRMKDQEFLTKIAIDSEQKEIYRIAAIKRIKDPEILLEISRFQENPKSVQNAAMMKKRLSSLCTKLAIEHTCQECSQPVFIYGPVKQAECHYCNTINSIDPNKDWSSFLENAFEKKISFLSSKQVLHGGQSLPKCMNCKRELDVDHIQNGDDNQIECKHCSTLNTSFPPPDWFIRISKNNQKNKVPVQIFCAVKEDTKSHDQTDPKKTSSKLIMFTCLQCGGALKISEVTPRILTCEYCDTDQYMPDTIWRTLHPIPKRREWYIRWQKTHT